LYALAEKQMGFVTTAQGAQVGVQPMTLVMMKKRGTLKRVSRGVYRLVDFPVLPLARYMAATLWPYELRGVLSHETALGLHDLVDSASPNVHITVPAGFRIQRKIPSGLVVHRADLSGSDVCRVECVRITTPERTIEDCIESNVEHATVLTAIENGLRASLLNEVTAAKLKRHLVAEPGSSGVGSVRRRGPAATPPARRPEEVVGSALAPRRA
jgi:predicted transcriptional regulator of viral defense system